MEEAIMTGKQCLKEKLGYVVPIYAGLQDIIAEIILISPRTWFILFIYNGKKNELPCKSSLLIGRISTKEREYCGWLKGAFLLYHAIFLFITGSS